MPSCANRRRPSSFNFDFELLAVLLVMPLVLKGLFWLGRSIISSPCRAAMV